MTGLSFLGELTLKNSCTRLCLSNFSKNVPINIKIQLTYISYFYYEKLILKYAQVMSFQWSSHIRKQIWCPLNSWAASSSIFHQFFINFSLFYFYIRGDWEGTVKEIYSPNLHTNKKAMTTNKAWENNTEKNGQTATEQMKTQMGCPDSGCIMHVHYKEMKVKVQMKIMLKEAWDTRYK